LPSFIFSIFANIFGRFQWAHSVIVTRELCYTFLTFSIILLVNMLGRLILIFLLLFSCIPNAWAEFVVTLRAGPSENSRYQEYYAALVKLALEKTRPHYGGYRIDVLPRWSWFHERALAAAIQNSYPNLLIEVSYEEKLTASGDLTYINFPTDGGIIGYRVCFVNPAIKDELKKVKSLEELRKYNYAQGVGWADTTVLRSNGFNVIEISNYESIFKMTVAGRVDLFCRGANQLKLEYDEFKDIKNIAYYESFMFAYPLPRFFYTNSKNKLAKKRIGDGLKIAYKDGSFKKLWLAYNQQNLDFAKLKQRKIYRLTNPLIKNLPEDYKQYFIDPMND
jgi:hypothetical protein